jgi:hypothetical protein
MVGILSSEVLLLHVEEVGIGSNHTMWTNKYIIFYRHIPIDVRIQAYINTSTCNREQAKVLANLVFLLLQDAH